MAVTLAARFRGSGRGLLVRRGLVLAALTLTAAPGAQGDEGMWPFERPPLARMQATYAFAPDAGWLDRLRTSTVSLGGATGSFVSPRGLVLTNHHVALSCAQKLSSAARDLVREGFLARTEGQELRCPGLELRRLESSEDVTAEVRAAVRADDAARANDQRNAVIAGIETACSAATRLRCEVDTRYRGAQYRLLRYKVWSDVRVVFLPEASVAFFGGDADNFVYPRFDLDVAFLRAYDDGAPATTREYLRLASAPLREGDLVLAAGHPYSTDRLMTREQLVEERDVEFPLRLGSAERQRRNLQSYSERSPEAARQAQENLFGTENWLKAMRGEYKALRETALIDARGREDERLRRARPEERGEDPWQRVAAATEHKARMTRELWAANYGWRTLFDTAGTLVELAYERALPDSERLPEYRESSVQRITTRITADAPTYRDLEIMRIADYWQEARDLLGEQHRFVRTVLAGEAPEAVATRMVDGTKLGAVEVRKRLLDGGIPAIEASDDPMIVLARRVYPIRREIARRAEALIAEPIRAAADRIARLRFGGDSEAAYPDATGSLRLSYGVVKGYDADGIATPWHTNLFGLYARSAAFEGRPPFDLPARWRERQRELALSTPLNFVSTLDIIGGNSGSPVVDRRGELVGVIFDGNLEGLGARYGYSEGRARAVAVDARAVTAALRVVYGASELLQEWQGH